MSLSPPLNYHVMKKYLFSLLAISLLIFSGCSQNKNEQTATERETSITIVLNENSTILIDDQAVNESDFSRALENRVNELTGNGASRDKIVVTLKVAKEVKMGEVMDLQGVLRQLNIRKLVYSTI